jgi:UDP-N-acetylglucosamine acyltransferase
MGNNNWVMAYVHVAHDCQVGNNVIFANSTQLAGHVIIDDFVILGGFTGVHQFCQIGAHVMTAVGTVLLHDIPPYVKVSGSPAEPHGLNSERPETARISSDALATQAHTRHFIVRINADGQNQLSRQIASPEVQIMADFLVISTRHRPLTFMTRN